MAKKMKKAMHELKTLDEIKVEFKNKYEKDGTLSEKDVMDAIDHLDLTDQDSEDLFQYFLQNGIELKTDSDEIEIDESKISDAVVEDVDDVDDTVFDDEDLKSKKRKACY